MKKTKEPKKEKRGPARRLFALLGPGLVTGAADDDPSGIVTYFPRLILVICRAPISRLSPLPTGRRELDA
jgi:hypothetical protein